MSVANLNYVENPLVRTSRLSNDRDHEPDQTNRNALRFVHINIIGCICLQRFGFIIGESELYLCFLIFISSTAWGFYVGALKFRIHSLALFILFGLSFLVSGLVALAAPRLGVGVSLTSLFGVLAMNAVFLVGPKGELSSQDVFKIFVFYVRVCCVVGIVQYSLQFIGIRIFTLGSVLPILKPFLVEAHYNTEGIVTWGSLANRANGIFPLEPGGFSQLIAIAMLIDAVVRKNFIFLPLYGIAYVLSYSGTGALCLALTLALAPIFAPKESKYVIIFMLAATPLFAILYFVFPNEIGQFTSRISEINTPGTSAYLRYVAQERAWEFFSEGWRLAIGSGPGAYERFPDYVKGSESTAVKAYSEYGLIGLALFGTFLISAVWNKRIPIISLMMLVTYQFGGGNLLQAPTLILMALLCIWTNADSREEELPIARRVRRIPRPWARATPDATAPEPAASAISVTG